MAETEAVHPSPSKKRRTDEVKQPSTSIFEDGDDDDEEEDVRVPLTEESRQLISEFRERHGKSGGFDVPKVPPTLLKYVFPPIDREDPITCRTDENLINAVNTAIRHHKKTKKKNEMMDLVLLEILCVGSEYCGFFQQHYITFKARDSSGAVRTYETLICPMFSDESVVLEIFRVKPYSDIEYKDRIHCIACDSCKSIVGFSFVRLP